MQKPNPELIDDENPEWTNEDFANAVPLSGLPVELQNLLTSQKHEPQETTPASTRQPAA